MLGAAIEDTWKVESVFLLFLYNRKLLFGRVFLILKSLFLCFSIFLSMIFIIYFPNVICTRWQNKIQDIYLQMFFIIIFFFFNYASFLLKINTIYYKIIMILIYYDINLYILTDLNFIYCWIFLMFHFAYFFIFYFLWCEFIIY